MGEGELRRRLASGGRIERAIVVSERAGDDGRGGWLHAPLVLASWRRGYAAIAPFRGDGRRAWRDLDRLVAFLRADLGYGGAITVHEAGCLRLSSLRSVGPGAAAPAASDPPA